MEPFIYLFRKVFNMAGAACRSLKRRKLRSSLSVLGVVCGVVAVFSMMSIGAGARREALRQIEQMGIRNIFIRDVDLSDEQRRRATETLSLGLSLGDAERIRRGCTLVEDVACLKEFAAPVIGMVRDLSPLVLACTPNFGRLQNLTLAGGRFINQQDVEAHNAVCVLGASVARRVEADARTGGFFRIGPLWLKVVGVLDEYRVGNTKLPTLSLRNLNEMVFVPFGVHHALVPRPDKAGHTPELSEIIVQVSETAYVPRAVPVLTRIMEVSHNRMDDYQMIVPQELLHQARQTRRLFNIVLGTIAAISLLVGGIGIMNIMLANVTERTREIGLRRAVGATRIDIAAFFLAEAMILTFCGGLIGILAGMGGVWLISTFAGWETAITAEAVVISIVMAVGVGIFFGLYPACLAARMDPVVALRHE